MSPEDLDPVLLEKYFQVIDQMIEPGKAFYQLLKDNPEIASWQSPGKGRILSIVNLEGKQEVHIYLGLPEANRSE